jgi:uncharacterized protein YigE (DUF2233 family)
MKIYHWAIFLGIILAFSCQAKAIVWQSLAPGLEYTTINFNQPYPTSKLHALRIDPSLYQFNSVLAKDIQRKAGLVSSFAEANNVLLAVNGGFFDPDYHSLGLRISQGQTLNPIKPISWWGIFLIRDHQPAIIAPDAYSANDRYDFAIQAGPRLLIKGVASKLVDKATSRSAVCITQHHKVVIMVTEHLSLTISQLAQILRKPTEKGGFNCTDALNLDGGHSSQLYGKIAEQIIRVPNLSPVADVVTVSAIASQ